MQNFGGTEERNIMVNLKVVYSRTGINLMFSVCELTRPAGHRGKRPETLPKQDREFIPSAAPIYTNTIPTPPLPGGGGHMLLTTCEKLSLFNVSRC